MIILTYSTGASLDSIQFDVIIYYIAGVFYYESFSECIFICLANSIPSIELERCSIFQRIPVLSPKVVVQCEASIGKAFGLCLRVPHLQYVALVGFCCSHSFSCYVALVF